jgi:hypothetical protein
LTAQHVRKEGPAVKDKTVETTGYRKPAIVDYGTLAQLTAGNKNGNFLDATFPVHTPKNKLTFSG